MAAPAMPVIMQANKTTITLLAIGVNRHFDYARYFSMVPVGPDGVKAFSRGYFELAAAQQPKPVTVAMIAADAEFARTAADGAKENAKALGFSIVHDRSYPPNTVDFGPIMRASGANADLVFVAAYPPDTVGIVRAAREQRLSAKMFGGAMIGLLATPLKTQLGPAMNNIDLLSAALARYGRSLPKPGKIKARHEAFHDDDVVHGRPNCVLSGVASRPIIAPPEHLGAQSLLARGRTMPTVSGG